MHERLSFYVKRDSVLHRLNPLTKIVLVFSLVLIAFVSPFYWTPQLLLPFAIIPLIFTGKIMKEYWRTALRLILPTAGILFVMQSLFLPGESRVLLKIWRFDITQASLEAALTNATRIVVMVSAFTVFLLTTHPSEMMSDLTHRGLPPQFAYVVISALQILPQMQAKAQTIISAQRSRGLETEGSYLKRAGSLVPLVGPLVFGSLVEVEERAIAIEARGFTSTKRKTFLRQIPDTNTDRWIRAVLLSLILITLGLRIWRSLN